MLDYTIRRYACADNAGLAVMWNESDDQWPGTFTGGVPVTAEIVQDWMEKETCLIRFVVEEETNGSIVGYGSLWESPGRKDSCYVALLNVHPAHQRRSLARRMLTRMVDWATSHGYHRVTIETWPGNLKSVPLYKKVGFFWVPDTDVYMENYIPAIRRLPVAQQFFERHDWYTTFRRELKQVEDEQRHPETGDMKVYVFRWEEDGEFLEIVVDRQGQAITGLETEHFAAYAVVDESEPARGITYPVRWRIANKRDESVSVSVLADGESDVKLDHRTSFDLGAGEERVVEAAFTCAVGAPRLDPDDKRKPAPKIRTALVIGCDVVELATGLRHRSAVTVGTEPEIPSLLPGCPGVVHLQLQNRAGCPLSGTVSISPQKGLTTDWRCREFELAVDGYAGLPLTVTCDQAGAVPLLVKATFVHGGRQVTTAPQRISLLSTPVGGIAADLGEDKVLAENDFFQVICRKKGGVCQLRSKARQRRDMSVKEELGPPFEPWDLSEREYDLALERGRGWAQVALTVQSDRFPGLTITREIALTGSPLIRVQYRLVNGSASSYKLQVRPRLWLADKEASHVALPRRARLVIERASEFPATEGDMPKKPEFLAEQWLAFSRDGQVAGAIWSQDVVEHEFWWESLYLYFAERTLEPQSAICVGPFYLYSGPGNWRDVRRAWRRAADVRMRPTRKGVLLRPEAAPVSDRPYAFGLAPLPLVTLNGQAEATLYANSVREREMEGRLAVEPPPDWTADRAEFTVESVALRKPFEDKLRLTTAEDQVGAFSGQLHMEAEQFDETRPFVVIRLGDEGTAVCVEKAREAGQPVWTVDNGRCVWTIAPDFHAGVIFWREGGDKNNHLLTAFPNDGELGWLKPWFGGVRPMIMPMDEDHGWPGKLHEEAFAAAPFESSDPLGLPWRGVQVTTSMKREGFRGLRAEIAYLTVGGSNVLKMVYRLVNDTDVYRHLLLGLLTFCQVDGQYEDTVLYGGDFQRKSTPQMSSSFVGPWGAAVNPITGRAAVMVVASGEKRTQVSDWGGDGGHLMAYNRVMLEPRGSHDLVTYLALVESLEEAQHYRHLS